MESLSKHPNGEDSDLKQLLHFLLRNYKVFVGCLVIAIALATLANRLMIPRYKIAASLLITEETRKTESNVNDYIRSNLFGNSRNIQNELWVLKSTPALEQMIRDLDLTVSYYQKGELRDVDAYGYAPFRITVIRDHIQPVNVRFSLERQGHDRYLIKAKGRNVAFANIETGVVDHVVPKWEFSQTGKFGSLIGNTDMAFVVDLDESDDKPAFDNKTPFGFRIHDIRVLTEEIKKNLSFNIVDKLATVIEVSFKSTSVEKGKNIVDGIMDVYSRQDVEHKKYIARITLDQIEEQLNEISDSLRFTEDELQSFRSSNQLLNFTEQATGISTQYMNLEEKLAELKTRKRYYDYVAEYLSRNEDFSRMIVPASMGISDQLLNNLMSDLIAAHAQRSNLIRNNQELNPMVQKLEIEIENLKKTITESINTIRQTTDISIDDMNNRLKEMKSAISKMPGTQRVLGGIERQYKLNDAIFSYLLGKRAEAKINLAFNIPGNMIIEPAKQVGIGPVSPNEPLNYLIAVLAGFIIPLGLLSFKTLVNSKIESQESVEQITDLPVIGKIMHNKSRIRNVMAEFPESNIAESYRTLRTNLEYHFRGMPKKLIMVTSCVPGEGKSFIALNLAMCYAQLGCHTLLINCDLRKETDYFPAGPKSSVGISSWFNYDLEIADIILHSPYKNLDVIQTGPLTVNPTEMLSTGQTDRLIDQLKAMYDCVVLDTSPVALVSDPYLLMNYADIKLMIARYNYTRKDVFRLIVKDLVTKNIKSTCIVMNDNTSSNSQYGYGYGYYKNGYYNKKRNKAKAFHPEKQPDREKEKFPIR